MQFPDVVAMSPAQAATNAAAVTLLTPGKTYRFTPPVRASGIPTGGPGTCAVVECEFETGWYLGFVDGSHTFQGFPINDTRDIPTPRGYEGAPNLDDIKQQFRACYFPVLMIGGSQVTEALPG